MRKWISIIITMSVIMLLPMIAHADEINIEKPVDTILKINTEEKTPIVNETIKTDATIKETVKDPSKEIVKDQTKEEDAIMSVEKPLDKNSATTNPKVLITGKGVKGLSVELSVYKKQVDENKLVTYEETYKDKFKIGEMGRFVKTIELKEGDNQVVLKGYIENSEEKVTIRRNIKYTKEDTDTTKKAIEEMKEKAFAEVMNQTISSVK